MKGLAILAISLHNFFHFVSPAQQNEFAFNPARFPLFLATVRHPALAIQAVFSFFGHFGVQIFIFLSAYGLARCHWESRASWAGFMKERIRKLYPAFALVVIPWFVVVALNVRAQAAIFEVGFNLMYLFLGLPPILGHGVPPVAPWWFISFIVQFYALWPFLRGITKRFAWPGLLVLSASCLVVCQLANPVLARYSTNLFLTPIGRMPVICFGIFAARYGVRVGAPLALAGLAVLLLGSQYGPLWSFTFLGALLVALWLYLQARGVLRRFPVLVRMGEYSLYVFLVNAIVRDQFVPLATSPASQLLLGCASTAVSFLIGACMHEFLLPGPDLRAPWPSALQRGLGAPPSVLPRRQAWAEARPAQFRDMDAADALPLHFHASSAFIPSSARHLE